MSSDSSTRWLAITPMTNLIISNEPPIDGNWRVGNVTFLSRESLRQLLRSPQYAAATKDSDHLEFIFGKEDHQSFAVTEETGQARKANHQIFRRILEATRVLSSSAVTITSRSSRRGFSVHGFPSSTSRHLFLVSSDGSHSHQNYDSDGPAIPFDLNPFWHEHITQTRMIALFDKLNSPAAETSWGRQIKSAAAMLGKSFMATDRADAFLFDVMGLETLLTFKGDRNGDKLASRINGMAGWALQSERPDFKDEVIHIHRVRCEVVHDSDYSNLTMDLLLLADLYLTNALINASLFLSNEKRIFTDQLDSFATREEWPTDGTVPFQWLGKSHFSHRDLGLPIW